MLHGQYLRDEAAQWWYVPLSLQIDMTWRCNCQCDCCANSSVGPDNAEVIADELRLPLIKAAIKSFVSLFRMPSVANLIFSGGEALLRSDALVAAMSFGHSLGLKSELITNGGLIGASSPGTDMQREEQCHSDILTRSPDMIADCLAKAGLEKLNISVDKYHNAPGIVGAVPLDVVASAIRAFMSVGFGTRDKVIHISTIREPSGHSHALLNTLMCMLGATKASESWWKCGEKRLYVYAQDLQRIGRARALAWDWTDGPRVMDVNCPLNLPHYDEDLGGEVLYPSLGGVPAGVISHLVSGHLEYRGIGHCVSVAPDGVVGACPNHIFRIGNLHEGDLVSVLSALNRGSFSGPYQREAAAWCLLQHIPATLDQERKGNIGQIIAKLLVKGRCSPEAFVCSTDMCYAIARNEMVQEVAMREFGHCVPRALYESVNRALQPGGGVQ